MIASPALRDRPAPAPVGGFFAVHEPPLAARGPSVLAAWTQGRPWAAFVNARSAFAALAACFPEAAVWLPAYVCADLVQPGHAGRLRFYGCSDRFEPDLTALDEAAAGDLVLLMAPFGMPVDPEARDFAARRPDLRFVEDRAQALAPETGVAGAWRLYSPRKLLGVADGGLLIAPDADAPLPRPTTDADGDALWTAPLLRQADPEGRDNARWHGANQAKEAAMAVSAQAMTPRSLAILERTSLQALAGPRLGNWRALDQRLAAWSALPSDGASTPLGYVLRLDPPTRDRLLRALHGERIFAAVHWPAIAAPAADFPREAAWTRQLLTLPCDHRYGPADMDRIAGLVEGVLA